MNLVHTDAIYFRSVFNYASVFQAISFRSLPKSCVHFFPMRATSPRPLHPVWFDMQREVHIPISLFMNFLHAPITPFCYVQIFCSTLASFEAPNRLVSCHYMKISDDCANLSLILLSRSSSLVSTAISSHRELSVYIQTNKMHRIFVIRLYFLLDVLHVSDCISPSSGTTFL